jgi:hypothetical protein
MKHLLLTGEISKEKMEGTLFEIRDFRPDS